jgi:hypothetical protein
MALVGFGSLPLLFVHFQAVAEDPQETVKVSGCFNSGLRISTLNARNAQQLNGIHISVVRVTSRVWRIQISYNHLCASFY